MTTTNVRPPASTRVPMSSLRKTALVGGALYVITFATSIPGRLLNAPVRNDPNYILGPDADTQVLFAGFLDVLVALACIGTAVALYPVVKRQNEGVALGFIGSPDSGSCHHRRRRREPSVSSDPTAGGSRS